MHLLGHDLDGRRRDFAVDRETVQIALPSRSMSACWFNVRDCLTPTASPAKAKLLGLGVERGGDLVLL